MRPGNSVSNPPSPQSASTPPPTAVRNTPNAGAIPPAPGKTSAVSGPASCNTSVQPIVSAKASATSAAATHGNARTPAPTCRRRIRNAEAKERIARHVAGLVPDGASIFLDTGTTCEAIARALLARRNLRVVSYSLRIAAYLRETTDFTIAIPGGFVRQVDGGVFQGQADSFIAGFKFDLGILSVSGVDDDGDLGDDDSAEVETVRAAIRQSARVLLAVDSSKFGHRGLVQLGSLRDVDLLISDAPPPAPIASRAATCGVDVETV